MVPLFILLFTFGFLRLLGVFGWSFFASWQHSLRFALAWMFFVTSSAHWGKLRRDLVRMVPPVLGHGGFFVTLAGILEVAGAVGLLFSKTYGVAGAGLAVLMVLVYPANYYANKNGLTLGGYAGPPLGLRTAIQVIFVLVALAAGWGSLGRLN